MKKIKTREAIKDVRILDRGGNLSHRMKKAALKSKEAMQTQDSRPDSPSEHAADTVLDHAERTMEGTMQTVKKAKDQCRKTAENINQAKKHMGDAKRQVSKVKKGIKHSHASHEHRDVTNAMTPSQDAIHGTPHPRNQSTPGSISGQKPRPSLRQSAQPIQMGREGSANKPIAGLKQRALSTQSSPKVQVGGESQASIGKDVIKTRKQSAAQVKTVIRSQKKPK